MLQYSICKTKYKGRGRRALVLSAHPHFELPYPLKHSFKTSATESIKQSSVKLKNLPKLPLPKNFSTFVLNFFVQIWKHPTISVCLDFLKCVQVCIFFKTRIFTASVSRFSCYRAVQICVLKKMKI